jgi:hypothetical protein
MPHTTVRGGGGPARAAWNHGGVTSIGAIRRIALGLPGAYEQPSFGDRPSWRTKPRMFAWVREDPEALVVWIGSVDEKDALIAAEPEKFFTTPHYDGTPIVLVRLEAVDDEEVGELITESWRLRSQKALVKEWGT